MGNESEPANRPEMLAKQPRSGPSPALARRLEAARTVLQREGQEAIDRVLSPRDQTILRLRLGLAEDGRNGRRHTYAQVSLIMGLHISTIRLIQNAALRKLAGVQRLYAARLALERLGPGGVHGLLHPEDLRILRMLTGHNSRRRAYTYREVGEELGITRKDVEARELNAFKRLVGRRRHGEMAISVSANKNGDAIEVSSPPS